jgi:hypothetical protein
LSIGRFSGNRWQSAHLFVPRDAGAVRLVAEAGPDGRWLAFAEPIELGFGSWLAHQARKFASGMIWLGAGMLAVGLVLGAPLDGAKAFARQASRKADP